MANCYSSFSTMFFRRDLVIFCVVLVCIGCVLSEETYAGHYTPTWAVHIKGGKEIADAVAAENGFVNLGQIFNDHYHFHHNSVRRRSVDPSHHHHRKLSEDSRVHWAKQQTLLSRRKRDFIPISLEPLHYTTTAQMSSTNYVETSTPMSHETLPMSLGAESPNRTDRDLFPPYGRRSVKGIGGTGDDRFPLNDHRWPQMWYLNRGGGLDMNVIPAWREGITGKGVVVTILDDGLEKDHPDLAYNYDPQASYDVNNHDEDPMPRYDLIDSNRHGTRCAGEVAATANNTLCAVGVAFGASVGGVRMLDGDVTDAVEARSLSLNPQHIDIYSASWGPDDDGKTVDGPGELATRAFIEGVTKGRSGKGSIFVWASGNGGRDQDNCNCDGYTNSIWTLSISSATERGEVPWYSEMCSSTLATTYSSGAVVEKQVITTDLHHSCTSSHTGTSASAPLAAGICALALEANRDLTWRDMQHIVVRTAKPANLQSTGWAVNGVGRNVSHSFGYGLMDATAMVQLARTWRTVPAQRRCEVSAPHADKSIPPKSQVVLQLAVNHCSGVNYLEHVQAKISLTTARRGDLQISLTSPAGTKVVLLAPRAHDNSRAGFNSWPFMSVHTWGETPYGVWLLEIHNQGRYMGRATLQDWALIFYGTTSPADKNDPSPYSNINRYKVDISQSVPVPSITIPATKPKTKGNNKSQNNIANQYVVSSNGSSKKNKNGKNQNRNSQGKNKSSIKPTATILRGISNKTTSKTNGKNPQRQTDFRLPGLNKKSDSVAKVTERPEQDTTLLVGVTKVFKQLPKVTKMNPYDTTLPFHTTKYQKNTSRQPNLDSSSNLRTGKPGDDIEALSRTSDYHFTTEEITKPHLSTADVSTNPPNFQGFIFIDQPPDGHVALKNSQIPSLFQKYPKIQHIYPALFPYPKVEIIANKPSRQHPPLSQFHPEYIGGFAPQEALDSDLETDHHISAFSSEDKGTLTQWDMIFYGTQVPAQSDYDSIHDLKHNPSLDGSNLSAGESEPGDHNSLEPESSSRWRDTQKIREDGRFDEHLTSIGVEVANSGCLSFSDHHRCIECSQEYVLYNGQCLTNCPPKTFTSRSFVNALPKTKPQETIGKNVESLTKRYVNKDVKEEEMKNSKNSQRNVMKPEPPKICLDCHYTCATCFGPYNYQCSSCPEDAKLVNSTLSSSNITESYCYPSQLLPRLSLSNVWTRRLYVVFAVVIVCLLLTMLFYLLACIFKKTNLFKCCNKEDESVVVSYNRLSSADEAKHNINIAKEIHSAIYDTDTESESEHEHIRVHP